MIRQSDTRFFIMPMYHHVFRFVAFGTAKDSKWSNLQPTKPECYVAISDKLRYYRYYNHLHQKEVASNVGISRDTYMSYEKSERVYYPLENMQKIAELFGIEITDLLDDYHLFLYRGQGTQLKTFRKMLQVTQEEFAEMVEAKLHMVKLWEQNKNRIPRKIWKKIFLKS